MLAKFSFSDYDVRMHECGNLVYKVNLFFESSFLFPSNLYRNKFRADFQKIEKPLIAAFTLQRRRDYSVIPNCCNLVYKAKSFFESSFLFPSNLYRNKFRADFQKIEKPLIAAFTLQRRRDSNPRYPCGVYTLSKRAP